MDSKQVGSALSTIAYGEAVLAAVRDYAKELNDGGTNDQTNQPNVDVDELLDDPELEKLHSERIQQLKQEVEKRAALVRKGHGSLQEISESDFLEIVTKTDRVACHFFHSDFERCKIVDHHLSMLARKHVDTRFIKLSALGAPFFVTKLGIKILPCIVSFINGVSVDKLAGFDKLGARDTFTTAELEDHLYTVGVIKQLVAEEDSDNDENVGRSARTGIYSGKKESDDEDSDFD